MRTDLRSLAEAAIHDPAEGLWASAGDLSDYEPFHNRILCATYIPPPKVMKREDGSDYVFHEPDKKLDENRYQGKVALVLKVGPLAFADDTGARFGGITVKPGDWLLFRRSNAWEFFIRDRTTSNDGLSVWLVQDIFVEGRTSDPSLIY